MPVLGGRKYSSKSDTIRWIKQVIEEEISQQEKDGAITAYEGLVRSRELNKLFGKK